MNTRLLGAALAALGLGLGALAACGEPPPPPGTPLDVQEVAARGPRIPNGAIFAAADLATLRSLIDAADGGLAGQLGGAPVTHECLAPYTGGADACWPGVTSMAGQAYLALDVRGGFCLQEGAPRLALSGSHLELQIPFSNVFGCHLSGSVALPTATLFTFPAGGLRPGLYSASFVFRYPDDTYRSDSAYLSVPGPPPGLPADMDREGAEALSSVVGARRAGLFSLARVDGAQLGGLCGRTVAGPAYLVTYEPDLGASQRQMAVALAGPAPLTCATARL